ncbi:hypothetical protein PIB30_041482 [Stylosanthes scabra]|uniref:PB1-like domain-containing protein n=1 Tax=Stylosanthes scabra TaxID=79078 RepID=A0ABU6SFL9_9FABA|nr:hypothetical protein [Stylosanthes scabra]
MATIFVTSIFHLGGTFVRNDDGELVYQDGRTEKFNPMDVDFVNYGGLVKLLGSIGYLKFKRLKWFDFTEDHLESGLHPLDRDAQIDEMGYESAEDELYKPPPEAAATETESEDDGGARKKGNVKGKRIVVSEKKRTPTKVVDQKGNGVMKNRLQQGWLQQELETFL